MNIQYESHRIYSPTESIYEQSIEEPAMSPHITDDADSRAATLSLGLFDGEQSRQKPLEELNFDGILANETSSTRLGLQDTMDYAHKQEASQPQNKIPDFQRIKIKGVNVPFLYEPYDLQREFMSTMIEAMQNGDNALLESPTGTGKTLSLLCAALAFQNSMDGDLRVVYATRTHAQVANVIAELKKIETAFPLLRVSVLAAKNHYCVNPMVSSERDDPELQSKCKREMASSSCKWFNCTKQDRHNPRYYKLRETYTNLPADWAPRTNKKMTIPEKTAENFSFLLHKVQDIEDLRKEGLRRDFCPHIVQRSIQMKSNLIIAPYNYLLDPCLAASSGIELEDSVVIFDEAHNVPSNAENGFSFDIFLKDFPEMLEDLDAIRDLILKQDLAEKRGKVRRFNIETSLNTLKELAVKIKSIQVNFERILAEMKEKLKNPEPSKESRVEDIQPASELTHPLALTQSNNASHDGDQPHTPSKQTSDARIVSSTKSSLSKSETSKTSELDTDVLLDEEKERCVEETYPGKEAFKIFELTAKPGSKFASNEHIQKHLHQLMCAHYNSMDIVYRLSDYVAAQQEQLEEQLSGIANLLEAINFMQMVDSASEDSLLVPKIKRKIRLMRECLQKLLILNLNDVTGKGLKESGSHMLYIDCFKTHVEYVCSDPDNLKISLWCFHAAPYFKVLSEMGFIKKDPDLDKLVRKPPRSFIFASGTLSPSGLYQSEIGLEFKQKLSNQHIINPAKQLFSCIVGETNKKTSLKLAYRDQKDDVMLQELGRSLVNFISVIPDGIVMFFSSNGLLDKCKNLWSTRSSEAKSTMDSISQHKTVFFESKAAFEMEELIKNFEKEIYRPRETGKPCGAILFAVFRGKASEGMNFSDRMARAVFLLGMPFLPCLEPRIRLKQQYLDGRKLEPLPSVNTIDSKLWYRLEAMVAVNQALGRVIRHRDDYGAVLFFDFRYKERRYSQALPKWVREVVNINEPYRQSIAKLCDFFRKRSSPEKHPSFGSDKDFPQSQDLGQMRFHKSHSPCKELSHRSPVSLTQAMPSSRLLLPKDTLFQELSQTLSSTAIKDASRDRREKLSKSVVKRDDHTNG